tara:strand:- start:13614 stop:14615 length:1002 start_codon:yes stop_codon:yes gene_type:complete
MSKKVYEVATKVDQDLKAKFQEAEKRNVSIQDFIQDFIQQFVSDQTKKAYITDLKNFFDFLKKGDVHVHHPDQIKGHHFQFYRDELIENGYSSATINRRLVAIRSFIKWAMACKLIDYNPLDVVKLPKVQTESPTLAFDDDEVIKMINSPDDSTMTGATHKLVMILLFSLGLRRSELVNITVDDLRKERKHWAIRIKGKGGKERHLPLASPVLEAIKEYTDKMATFGVQYSPGDYLLCTQKTRYKNTPMSGTTVYRIIEKYAKACGINKKVSPHSCRATAISHLLDTQKTPIRDVAIFAGHSKITTTERYDKRREGLDNSAAYDIDYKSEKVS